MAPVLNDLNQGLAGVVPDGNDDEAAFIYAEQMVYNICFSMVMKTAVDLDLFEIIAGAKGGSGPGMITAVEIADQLPAANKEEAAAKVDRMLRVLAAFSLVTCTVDGKGRRLYGVAAAGRYFVRGEEGVSLGPLLRLSHDRVDVDTWFKLKESILEGGIAFNKAHGMYAYEYEGSDPKHNQVFNLGMFNYSTIVMKKILQRYKGFESLKQLVDVGGGIGHTLKAIVSEYPTIKGINFDLPHVIEHAPSIPGVEHVGGDMFESIPTPADAILMKWLVPVLSDEEGVKLLKNCYNALPKNGKVIIIEYVMEDEGETSAAARVKYLRDVLVMSRHYGGRDRTRKEYTALANAAGFTAVKFESCGCNCSVIEFNK